MGWNMLFHMGENLRLFPYLVTRVFLLFWVQSRFQILLTSSAEISSEIVVSPSIAPQKAFVTAMMINVCVVTLWESIRSNTSVGTASSGRL
jgi:hypothetical protein